METPPFPRPPDLWPNTAATSTHRLPGNPSLFLEVPPDAQADLLKLLDYAVHQEMRSAGMFAARENTTVDLGNERISSEVFSRRFTAKAARLHSIYTALYAAVRPEEIFDLTPKAMKESASRFYELGFHEEKQAQQRFGIPCNDGLYEEARGKRHQQGPKLHR
jgi:hypothetical protein